MHVAVYRAAVPAKTKNEFKRHMLTAFAQGVAAAGDQVSVVDQHHTVDADIAVLQGWVGMKTGAHLALRQQVIDQQLTQGRHVLVIDSNLFGFLEPEDFNRYLRYSLDGIFPTTGWYFHNRIDHSRWSKIAASYGFTERAWRKQGRRILICLQRSGGWSMDGRDVLTWLRDTVNAVQCHTDRPILIRTHPGSRNVIDQIRKQHPGIKISNSSDLRQDLDKTWATVTYNSSPGVASVIWGVPAFVTDPCPQRSQAWPWVDTDMACIEKPALPDRTDFYHRLSQCHWHTEDLASGEAWKFFRERLPGH